MNPFFPERTFVIAEVGINHNGDIKVAKDLIQGAKWAGADAVKFQKRTVELVYPPEELSKSRESPWGVTNGAQKQGLELTTDDYNEIDRYCKEIDIEWFASPWDIASLHFLEQYNLIHNKLASARLGHIELVEAMAKQKKYTYISTGMSTLEEIKNVVEIFKKYECPFELMHCNSAYPADDKELNLYMIHILKSLFNCRVGYSGHEVGLTPSIVAVALGANSIERHITLNRYMYGTDQAASIEVQGFRRMVDMIRVAEVSLGTGFKTITETEQKCRAKLWRETDVH
jgi:N-acetylneuraminate synthase